MTVEKVFFFWNVGYEGDLTCLINVINSMHLEWEHFTDYLNSGLNEL